MFTLGVQYSSVNTVGVQYSSVNTMDVQYSSVNTVGVQYSNVNTVGVQYSSVNIVGVQFITDMLFSAAVSDHCLCRGCSVQQCQTAVRGPLLALWVFRVVVRLVSVWIGRCRWQLSDGCPR